MILLLLLIVSEVSPAAVTMWELRAGNTCDVLPPAVGASLYLSANTRSQEDFVFEDCVTMLIDGDASMILPLASILVSRGGISLAEVYWKLGGYDLPATRNDLLGALAWFGRYDLHQSMALGYPIPPDMEGRMHSDHCAAICALGWMNPRKDGLFHGEDLVSPADIRRLSLYFASVDGDRDFLSRSELDTLFLGSEGLPR